MKQAGTNKCSRCKEYRDIGQFYKKRDAKNGLSCWCKKCISDSNFERGTVCVQCGEKKPRDYFHKDANSPTGRNPKCRRCQQGRVRRKPPNSVLWDDPVDYQRILKHLGMRAVGLDTRQQVNLWNESTDLELPRMSMKDRELKEVGT